MRDDLFEQEVAGLFAAAPAFDDGEAFVRRGLERLAAYERLRQRVLISVSAAAVLAAVLMLARSPLWASLAAKSAGIGTLIANTPLTTWCVLAAAVAGVALLLNRQALTR